MAVFVAAYNFTFFGGRFHACSANERANTEFMCSGQLSLAFVDLRKFLLCVDINTCVRIELGNCLCKIKAHLKENIQITESSLILGNHFAGF